MDKVIVTALLVIAGVISAVLVFNSVYPAIGQSNDAITNMEGRLNDRLKSQIQIIQAAKSDSDNTVLVWVKNIGSLKVAPAESCDVFFGLQGNFVRIAYGLPGTVGRHWEYTIENDTAWNPTRTMRIMIVGYSPLDPGTYYVKVVTPNGVSDEYLFSW